MPQHDPIPPLSPAMIRRAVVASTIGNGLEWFDFLIYGSLAGVISQVFFPAGDPLVSLILTWGTFGVGFVVRPLGGVLLGMYADRRGRRKALSLLILLMAAGTAGLGLTPGYATIGLAAPALVLVSRVLQGLSVGGEFASATAMLVEYAPARKKMFYGSFQMCSQAMALGLSAAFAWGVSRAFTPAGLAEWGWRIPFLAGGLVGPIGFYIRRRVAESPEFTALVERLPTRQRTPLRRLLALHARPVLCAIGVIVCGTASVYLWNIYLPVYVVRTLHLPSTTPLLGAAVCGALNVVLVVAIGALADRVGGWRVFLPAVAVAGAMSVPLFSFLLSAPSLGHLFAIQVLANIVFAFMAAPIPGLLAAMFPTAVRSTGMAVAYNLSVALFGGLAPLTVTWLTGLTGSRLTPAWYLTGAAALTLALVAAFRERPAAVVVPAE
jgi:MHS family proline/betaine transporter-like MFS transporter